MHTWRHPLVATGYQENTDIAAYDSQTKHHGQTGLVNGPPLFRDEREGQEHDRYCATP